MRDYANRTPLDVAKLRKRNALLEYFMVFIFAKNAEMLFEEKENVYYTIPALVIHTCTEYYTKEQ